jgi:hypothetical protein
MKTDRIKRFTQFIIERHAIYIRKSQGEEKPWTKDLILQRYRFCNVYRELDTVTQWVAKCWRKPHEFDPDLWFAMAVARVINWPETLFDLGYPIPWSEQEFMFTMQARKEEGAQIYNGAYMISTHGVKMDKAKYLAKKELTPLWKNRYKIRPKMNESLFALHERLIQQRDLGSFMSGQIIADLKYAKPYLGARDWHTFAVSGPGSRRGLNRVIGWSVGNPWKEAEWYKRIIELKAEVDPVIKRMKMQTLHAQDLQNCLCEFDKYERVRLGEGRPKSTYPGV